MKNKYFYKELLLYATSLLLEQKYDCSDGVNVKSHNLIGGPLD